MSNQALKDALELVVLEAEARLEAVSTPKRADIEQLKVGYLYTHVRSVAGNLLALVEEDKHA